MRPGRSARSDRFTLLEVFLAMAASERVLSYLADCKVAEGSLCGVASMEQGAAHAAGKLGRVGKIAQPILIVLGLLLACTEKAPPPPDLKAAAPQPLKPLDPAEAAFQVAPAAVFGEEPPSKAVRLSLKAGHAKLGEEDFALDSQDAMRALQAKAKEVTVLLSAQDDTFLAQAAPALEALDEAGATVWIQHPAEPRVAFPVLLRDEASFQIWIDEPKLGKVRAIQRADGFELMTKIGKLPGTDPNGPTVPVRGGQMDIATLRRGLSRLKDRFPKGDDACLVPSFGTELQAVARALSGFWSAARDPIFSQVCLVYPRPVPKHPDGGH